MTNYNQYLKSVCFTHTLSDNKSVLLVGNFILYFIVKILSMTNIFRKCYNQIIYVDFAAATNFLLVATDSFEINSENNYEFLESLKKEVAECRKKWSIPTLQRKHRKHLPTCHQDSAITARGITTEKAQPPWNVIFLQTFS